MISGPDSHAISTRGLQKHYGDTVAVAGIDLDVRQREVYGFLGRNGAGKTTTMRMLVGLVRPSAGTIFINGKEFTGSGSPVRIGALIEAPTFYPHLSGTANLTMLTHYFGVSKRAVAPALTRVGLSDRAESKFGGYSLGMKQRLGVAAALLGDPEILVLDEPTNGLDPTGMAYMRSLVRSLCDDGRTVFLSSHLLREAEQVCDRVGIIHEGKLVAQGPLSEIRDSAGNEPGMVIAVDDTQVAKSVVEQVPGVARVEVVDRHLEVAASPDLAAQINQSLVVAGVSVAEMQVVKNSLETAFLGLTGDRDDAAESPEAAG